MKFHRSPAAMERELRCAALRLALAGLARPALDFSLDRAIAAVCRRRPAITERLGPLAGSSLLIEFSDLPRALILCLAEPPRLFRLRLAGPGDREAATAAIHGPLSQLLDLLDGRIDGDAMFFARDLAVSGDTGLVVALRNAIDGEEIDLGDDLLDALGPLSPAARRLRAILFMAADAADRAVGRWQARLLAPALARCDELAGNLAELRGRREDGATRRGR